jgi:hypothetical protein
MQTVDGPVIALTLKMVTAWLIDGEEQYGATVWTCWTEMVPGPDQRTVTGFAVFDPTIVPPVTLHWNV